MRLDKKSILQSRKNIKHHFFSVKYFSQEMALLTKRLLTQIIRRPSSIGSGIIQPLLWLILFGHLFQNAPVNLLNTENEYGPFLSCGIIVFTCFTGSLNAGLPLMFDREFGFLNRILTAPLTSKNTIILSATVFMVCVTLVQASIIMLCSFKIFNYSLDHIKLSVITAIVFLVTSSISSISLSITFILPGHIEFLALILIINLPMLFASTALAPLYFMPYWLQLISKLNPLTYAIEGIRSTIGANNNYFNLNVINTFGVELSLSQILISLTVFTAISFISSKHLISNRLE